VVLIEPPTEGAHKSSFIGISFAINAKTEQRVLLQNHISLNQDMSFKIEFSIPSLQ
jgi:hypothetical protein